MKNPVLLMLAFALTFSSASGQINWGDYSQSFPGEIQESPSAVGLILAIRKENNAFWKLKNDIEHFVSLTKDPDFRKSRPSEMVARVTFDTAQAHFFLHGVNERNAREYQFHVTEYPGNRIVVPWGEIHAFTDSTVIQQSGMPLMAYLGGYRTKLGYTLIMDVRKADSKRIVATSMVGWEPVKPVITSIYTSATLDAFFRNLQSTWMPDKQSTGSFSSDFTVPSSNTNLVFKLEDGQFDKKQIQYELIRNERVYTAWRNNDYDNSFVWIKDCPPGDYVIKIRYSAQPHHVTEYRFNVEPLWYQTSLFRISAGILVAMLLGLSLLLIRQRRKARQEQIDKTRIQLELQVVYAQLNPHFIFNALSSIQALINKQDIQGANNYLSDFARLTRNSLLHSQKNEIALQEEIQTLDTYLRLEKLRFGFEYTIAVDPEMNIFETAIPALLLQPLVENAVKHGVGSLGEMGRIGLEFSRSGDAMVVILTDNGKGFGEQKPSQGLGLKLTRDRIALLNQLHQEWRITLEISDVIPAGARITLTFNQWF
ncbi:sensor histidine kinase [Dyadobacter sp. CY323]|uniref:sensor histidine kinase n=1 Tax=Dyadobacter sp. CY323 TaxID=2907302 RepID=UPI001F165B2E|nr:histidine kinase [Dyadobacter sp. CY323]MCE6991968.1 histidine kinase [Dyadobacter sp. CY323]